MRFTLMGFDQKEGVRLYKFQEITDGIRTHVTVGVDLAFIGAFGIHIQELPLLCRELLERQEEGQEKGALTLTEGEMRVYADNSRATREAAANRKRKFKLTPPAEGADGAARAVAT